jgi:lipopolysaccharide transport system ATP-binding protein
MDFQRKCINSLLEAANSDVRTVLYVSHNMNSIRQLCKRCIVLDKGKVIFEGDVNQAISIYLGAKELMPAEIEYGPEHRPDDYRIRKRQFFTIEKLHLSNKADPIFDESESATLDFTCHAERDLTKIGFRFELWYQDGSKIATSMPGEFADFKCGKNTVRITLPMANLTPGRYSADIIAFKVDEFGTERKLDAVYPGFTFQVEASRSKQNYMKWNHQYWGAIRLDDNHLSIIGHEEEPVSEQDPGKEGQ